MLIVRLQRREMKNLLKAIKEFIKAIVEDLSDIQEYGLIGKNWRKEGESNERKQSQR